MLTAEQLRNLSGEEKHVLLSQCKYDGLERDLEKIEIVLKLSQICGFTSCDIVTNRLNASEKDFGLVYLVHELKIRGYNLSFKDTNTLEIDWKELVEINVQYNQENTEHLE